MGFSKVFVLLVSLGAAAFAKEEFEAVATVEGCVIDCYHSDYYQHPSDCTKYVLCTYSGPVVMSCPDGTFWDQEYAVCRDDESVACETGNYLTLEGKSCAKAKTTPGKCSFKCPVQNGNFANPKDCGSYFYCLFGIPIPVQCPKGLHFNEKTKRCGLQFLAKCQASPDAEC